MREENNDQRSLPKGSFVSAGHIYNIGRRPQSHCSIVVQYFCSTCSVSRSIMSTITSASLPDLTLSNRLPFFFPLLLHLSLLSLQARIQLLKLPFISQVKQNSIDQGKRNTHQNLCPLFHSTRSRRITFKFLFHHWMFFYLRPDVGFDDGSNGIEKDGVLFLGPLEGEIDEVRSGYRPGSGTVNVYLWEWEICCSPRLFGEIHRMA